MIKSSSSLQTYSGAVELDWLQSGISPDLIRANRQAIRAAVGEQLQLWIENFIGSFKEGRLKTVLSNSVWFSRQPVRVWHGDREIVGLAVRLLPEDRQTCKYLLSKLKTLRYRVRQIDPEVKILSLSDPIGERAVNVVIESGEVMLTFLPRGNWL